MKSSKLLLAPVLALAWLAAAHAQPVRADNADVELVAATDAVVPAQPLSVGLRIRHDPEWHTYWQVPGDSGLPTRIHWKLPPGWNAGPIEWPVPKRMPVGPLMNFGYDGEVLLLTQLTPPADLKPGGQVEFAARADFLICRDVCIPSGANLTLSLPVRDAASPSRRAAQFAATRALVPLRIALQDAAATIEDDRILLSFRAPAALTKAEFFPLEEARIEPAAPQIVRVDGDRIALYLTAAKPIAAGFTRLKGVLVAGDGPARADRGGWAGEIEVALAPDKVAPVEAAGAAVTAGTPITLWFALIGALVGGLTLNLMPCVFPVLSLKLLSLLQHQREEDSAHVAHASLRTHGFVFAVGVVASFVLLAAAMLALRAGGAQLGWGFQLQTPWVIAGLTALFFVIGLNLLGAFELNVGTRLANAAPAQRLRPDRISGSFGTGVLAVVVAAPCTAPFMGAALGYAITQPAAEALLVFAALGLGMALPYLLLTFFPSLLTRLPRPGPWMERFRQIMAFPMFATCVWLLWVLAQQVNVNALALTLGALVLIALAVWALGIAQRGAARWRWVALGAAGVAFYAVAAATGPDSMRANASIVADAGSPWQAWSLAEQQKLLAAGKPVFVDFTAAWCVTCQANKQLVLKSRAVVDALSQKGVTLLRADWTNRDDAITRELARFERNGVPLYVLYDRRGKAQVLPELLTERIVLDALRRI
jgi:thiol:disulfide interchange protein/DsbC/DsbD-like thiol-disulfide interchange protein